MSIISYEEKLFNSLKNWQTTPQSTYDLWKELGNEGDANVFLQTLKGTSAIVKTGVTVSSSAWSADSTGLYVATIEDTDIVENCVVNVNFDTNSINEAISSGILGYTDATVGSFKLFSNFAPTADFVIDYAIIKE